MTKPAYRVFYPLISAVAVTMIVVPCAGLANTSGAYLNWQSKAAPASTQVASTNVVNTSNGPYPVPPSPYGQVGDPYARALRWPAKAPEPAPQTPQAQTPQPQSAQQTFVPVPQAPVRAPQVASISTPVPLSAPRPVEIVPVSPPVEEREDPGLDDDPGMADDPSMADDVPNSVPAPVVAAPAPQPKPATSHAEQMAVSQPIPAPKPAPVVVSIPAPTVTAKKPGDGYQVPATSKYASRIESARAAQTQSSQAAPAPAIATVAKPDAKKPNEKTPEKSLVKPPEKPPEKPPVATAPEPGVSMAVRETDHVFIPGEQYTSAADEPRYYSLHRQYGLRPDPIPATHEASGALLGGTINTVEAGEEGGDPNDDTADTDKKSASH